jgi:hypothetical protein
MGSYCRFALVCLVVVSATGSSGRDTATIAHAVRVTAAEAPIVQSQRGDPPRETRSDTRERQMLAWLILLMKDGPGAR